jgi:hypothetical protein
MKKVFGFDTTAQPPIYGEHVFEMIEGHLVHSFNGIKRATVPPAGIADYEQAWPDCRGLAVYEQAEIIRAANAAAALAAQEAADLAARTAADAAAQAEIDAAAAAAADAAAAAPNPVI